jgi:hypothetical protein
MCYAICKSSDISSDNGSVTGNGNGAVVNDDTAIAMLNELVKENHSIVCNEEQKIKV